MIQNEPSFLSIKQLCKVLQISRNSAYNLIKQDTIKAVKVGRVWRIPSSSISHLANFKKEN